MIRHLFTNSTYKITGDRILNAFGLKLVIDVSIYMQPMNSADNIFRGIFLSWQAKA